MAYQENREISSTNHLLLIFTLKNLKAERTQYFKMQVYETLIIMFR